MERRQLASFQEAYSFQDLPSHAQKRVLECAEDIAGIALRGSRLLDVGCGNTDERLIRDAKGRYHGIHKRAYEPWLSRLAVWQGAHVTGVDFAPEAPEVLVGGAGGTWEYIQHDVSTERPFAVEPEYDVVVMNGLLHARDLFETAPGLLSESLSIAVTAHRFPNFASSLPRLTQEDEANLSSDMETYRRMRLFVLKEIMRVLHPGGVFIFNGLRLKKPHTAGDLMLTTHRPTARVLQQHPGLNRMPFEAREVTAFLDSLQNR